MADKARLVQERVSENAADGSPVYRIVSTLTQRGQLPDHGVFVFTIVASDDPEKDTFFRVAAVPDLSDFKFGRDNAVQNGDAYYRVAGLTVEYDAFDAAEAASTTIKERVDTLTNNWIAASAAWIGSEAFNLPTGDPTVEETYTAQYQAAYTAYLEALVTRDAVQSELDVLKDKLEEYEILASLVRTAASYDKQERLIRTTLRSKIAALDAVACTGVGDAQLMWDALDELITNLSNTVVEADATQRATIDALRTEIDEKTEAYSSAQNSAEQTKRESDRTEQQLADYCPNIDVTTIQNTAATAVAAENTPAITSLATS